MFFLSSFTSFKFHFNVNEIIKSLLELNQQTKSCESFQQKLCCLFGKNLCLCESKVNRDKGRKKCKSLKEKCVSCVKVKK